MKNAFYYVDEKYIEYLKETEINARNYTTVPNVKYANSEKFVYGTVMKINGLNYFAPVSSYKNIDLIRNSCDFRLLERAYRDYVITE